MNKKQKLDVIYCILKNEDWEVPYIYELVEAVMSSQETEGQKD